MNYYERHIGDYLKDTAHLTLLEHGVYTRLLDVYYTREEGIPEAEVARLLGARSREEREALQAVLKEFFVLSDGTYTQDRADREIERFRDKQRKAKRSADARWSAQRAQSDGNANASADGMRTHSGGNAPSLQSPVTSNLDAPFGRVSRARMDGPDGPTPEEILADYPTSPNGSVGAAIHAIGVLIAEGEATASELQASARRFAAYVAAGGVSDSTKVMGPQRFFARTRPNEPAPWSKPWEPPRSKAQIAQDANVAAAQEWLARSAS